VKSKKLLDSYALIKFFNDEPGAQLVESILSEAHEGKSNLYLTEINAGETYYIIAKKNGWERAEEILNLMRTLPIQWLPANWDQVIAAARLKAQYPLSYADCFALAAAIDQQAELVTGDPEFKSVARLLKIRWV
jgi:ribonuclease VapC